MLEEECLLDWDIAAILCTFEWRLALKVGIKVVMLDDGQIGSSVEVVQICQEGLLQKGLTACSGEVSRLLESHPW